VTSFSFSQPEFFAAMNAMLAEVPIADWKVYLRWHLVNGYAEHLSRDFVNQDFEFFSKTLTGAKELQPRWKRVMNATNGALGEAVGQLFVAEAFPAQSKQRMLEMIAN